MESVCLKKLSTNSTIWLSLSPLMSPFSTIAIAIINEPSQPGRGDSA